MFGIVEYETFALLRLMIFFNSWPSGKQESVGSRNFLPTLVEIDWEYGGLNHVTFLDLDLRLAGGTVHNVHFVKYDGPVVKS